MSYFTLRTRLGICHVNRNNLNTCGLESLSFRRHSSGITIGWLTISHKYGDTIEDTITKLEYDLYYIKHISVSLDMYIILNTLKTVLLGRGAQ